MSQTFCIEGQLVDILQRKIYPAKVCIKEGIIDSVEPINIAPLVYIMPGFIDAHVHIESSLLTPSGFARLAVGHGTVATISDPHEIANVLGIEGVEYMLENAAQVPFHFFFGAPSCVPATVFETAGATLDATAVSQLLANPKIYYLSEMMNYPGVIYDDPEVMKKIATAHQLKKPVDGHAPGLAGDALDKYIGAGISTDHECFTEKEALEKLRKGMKVLIREGSAARNFEALIPLLPEWYKQLMFCSDDKHPDGLVLGHINQLVARAVAQGFDLFAILEVACLNPIAHYQLPIGTLKVGEPADFIVVKDLQNFEVLSTFINGRCTFENGQTLIPHVASKVINQFRAEPISVDSIFDGPTGLIPVIGCLDGQLITEQILLPAEQVTPQNDCLKLVVINRYQKAKPAIAYVKNFGLKNGAIASSVAHDSHNIIAVGVSDEAIVKAVNLVIASKGGLSAVDDNLAHCLELPVAGLMSNADAFAVAKGYGQLHDFSKNELGSTLGAPFMSLSFMALLVIPHLKLSDLGLFNGDSFSFVN
jgi:adenine deaminase